MVSSRAPAPAATRRARVTVLAADGLVKRDVFRLPDPFAIVTVDGEQTQTTQPIKKSLNPYWNDSFVVYVCCRPARQEPGWPPCLALGCLGCLS